MTTIFGSAVGAKIRFYGTRHARTDPAAGKDGCSADVVDLDDLVSVMDQRLVEELVQLLDFGLVRSNCWVQHLGQKPKCLVGVVRPNRSSEKIQSSGQSRLAMQCWMMSSPP